MTWRPNERSRHGGCDEIPLPTRHGRLWLCGKHYVGPDPEHARREVGATTVVCLTERHELEPRYPHYVEWLETNSPLCALWFPIPDLEVLALSEMLAIAEELTTRLAQGESILAHCGAGIGRAGTVATVLLMTMGVARDEALQRVATHRPMAGPEAGSQRALIDAVAAQLGASRPPR